MTELLVVLLILAILLALVAGISKYVIRKAANEDTVARQKIVMNAINRYYEETGAWPTAGSTGELMSKLDGQPACREILKTLPPEAWAGGSNALKDGFDEDMQYDADGGFGGRPVLISKGGNRQLDTSGESDDIRSDRQ